VPQIQIQHILCPIDFSDFSRRALDYAVACARWYHATVSVLHVHRSSTPVLAMGPFVGPEALQSMSLTDVERGELLAHLNDHVASDRAAGIAIDTHLYEAIDVPGSILSCASSLNADLIALGTHGRSGFERLMLGSVTEKVLRRAACPVLTVPAHAPVSVPRVAVSFERILCPVDFSKSSARALEYAASLAQEAHARLTVLHVLELPPDLSELPHSGVEEYRAGRFEAARRHLKDAVKALPTTFPVDDLLLVGRSAYREILRVATEQEADLIVMGIQGRAAVDLMLFGSTTNHVVRQATCPVLTLGAG
jgi:nucleotide-binding universal stress UspA family protein